VVGRSAGGQGASHLPATPLSPVPPLRVESSLLKNPIPPIFILRPRGGVLFNIRGPSVSRNVSDVRPQGCRGRDDRGRGRCRTRRKDSHQAAPVQGRLRVPLDLHLQRKEEEWHHELHSRDNEGHIGASEPGGAGRGLLLCRARERGGGRARGGCGTEAAASLANRRREATPNPNPDPPNRDPDPNPAPNHIPSPDPNPNQANSSLPSSRTRPPPRRAARVPPPPPPCRP